MDGVPNISGIDPIDLINRRGLLRSIFNISNEAIFVIEPALTSSGSLLTLQIRFANDIAQRLFQSSLASQTDFLSFNITFQNGRSWKSYLDNLLHDNVLEDEVLYEENGHKTALRFVTLKAGDTKLLFFFKHINERKYPNPEFCNGKIISRETEQMLNFGSWEYDIEKESMSWSKGMYEIFNLPEDSPISVDKYLDYAMLESKSLVEDFITRVKTDECTFEEDLPLNIKGEQKLIHVKSSPIKDESGRVCRVVGVDVDITEKASFKKELSNQQHFIEQILQASPVLINIYDISSETYIYFSKEVSPFVGYTSDTMLSMNPDELQGLIEEGDKQRVLSFFHGFTGVRDDEIRTIEYRIKAIDNTYRWLKVRAKAFMRNENGDVSQIICAIQDHTLTKEAEDKLRENELMQLLLQRKDEFINVASHELKTPITTVKASLQILQRMMERHEKDSVISLFLQKALSQVNKLAVLAKDLIDNAKLQSGKIRLNYEAFDLDNFFSEAIEEQIDGFEIIVQNTVHRPVIADRQRLEQVLKNFLSNAAKYSPLANRIIIKAEEEENGFKISVQDFGIGIPQDKILSVFERYYRVDDKATQFSGLGLGLHICAEIIKMHGGEYGADSVLGEGSTFWFTIPDVRISH